jgi:hypothetical protein
MRQAAALDRMDTMLGTIDDTISALQENPSRAGLVGSVRMFAHRTASIASDVPAPQMARQIQRQLSNLPGVPSNMLNYFDPALPQTEIWENTIALELAKLRILSGGSSIRAIETTFQAAKENVRLRGGLFGSSDAIVRLQEIRREFEMERTKLQRRMGVRQIQMPQTRPPGQPDIRGQQAPQQQAPQQQGGVGLGDMDDDTFLRLLHGAQ